MKDAVSSVLQFVKVIWNVDEEAWDSKRFEGGTAFEAKNLVSFR